MTPGIRPLVVGNWKMNRTATEAAVYARALAARLRPAADREVAIAPPHTALAAVAPLLRGSGIALAAQDLFWEDEGPFTGEISGPMLRDAGVTYVLVGHSERRRYLEETDRMAARKVRAALRCGLRPVLCVGEDLAARDAGRAESVVRAQLERGLEETPRGEASRLVIAYEPVWAIGTGRAATCAQAAEMHDLVRRELRAFDREAGGGIRVLYGGSVSVDNVDAILATPGVDGVLVGGASLKEAEFERIAAFRA